MCQVLLLRAIGVKNFPKLDKREDNSYIPQIGMKTNWQSGNSYIAQLGMRTNWQSSLQTFVVAMLYWNVAVAVPNSSKCVSVCPYASMYILLPCHLCMVTLTSAVYNRKTLSLDRAKTKKAASFSCETSRKTTAAYTLEVWMCTWCGKGVQLF